MQQHPNRKPIKISNKKGIAAQQTNNCSPTTHQNNSDLSPQILSPPSSSTTNNSVFDEKSNGEEKTNRKERVKAKRSEGLLSNFFKSSRILNENSLNHVKLKIEEIIDSRNLLKETNFELCELVMSNDKIKNESISQQEIVKLDLLNRQLTELESFETDFSNFIQSNTSSNITPHVLNAINTRNSMREECMKNLNDVTNLLGETLELMKDGFPIERLQKIEDVHSKILSEEDVLSVFDNSEKFSTSEFTRRSTEYYEWVKQSSQNLILRIKSTNAAFSKFLEEMDNELEAMLVVKAEEKKMLENLEYIVSLTPIYLEEKKKIISGPNEKKLHMKELHSYYLKQKTEMESKIQHPLKPDPTSVYNFYCQLNSLKTELREAKRNHLRLKFEKENQELDGVAPSVLQSYIQKVQEASDSVHRIEEKIQSLDTELEKSIKIHPEILLYINNISKQDELIPISIKDTKLEVKRSIKDYEIMKIINPRVCKAKFANQISIIKQYSFSDNNSRKKFMKEVQILHKFNHPCIAKIEAFFSENEFVFVQIEYKGDLTLADWLLKNPTEYEKRNVFHSVAQTLKYVHDLGIIHCDIKPDNIIMSPIGSKSIQSIQEIFETYRPILIDFDISVDKNSLQNSLAIRSTLTYLAPEVVHAASTGSIDLKNVLNSSIDVWSFGVMMFKAYYPNDEVLLLPNESTVRIPEHENPYLQDLLSNILQRDPNDRPCAEDIYSHIYFNSSIMNELVSQKQIVNTEVKMESFNRFLHHYKKRMQNNSEVIQIRMRREVIVSHTLQAFTSMEANDLLLRFQIQFIGEIGMDLGGITSNLYTEFFRQSIQSEHGIFEYGGSKNGGYLPNPNAPVEVCESIGKILIKTIYDQRVIPEVLSPFIFKFLSHKYSPNDPEYNTLQVTFRDLEQYDESLARSLRMLLAHEGVHEWEISFDGLCQDSPNRIVNDQNKHEYVKLKMRNVLLTSRLEQLKAIKRGFNFLVELQPQLALFSWREIMLLCCGKDYIDSKSVIDILKFKDFPTNSRTPQFFTQFISSLSSIQLRQFIEFSTGQCGISYGWQTKSLSISVQYVSSSLESLPVSHICSFIVDLPDYNNYQLLETKLKQVFEFATSSSGFNIA